MVGTADGRTASGLSVAIEGDSRGAALSLGLPLRKGRNDLSLEAAIGIEPMMEVLQFYPTFCVLLPHELQGSQNTASPLAPSGLAAAA
jgi:hypothetical protein